MFSGIGGFELGIERAALSVWDGQTENTESSTLEQSVESATKSLQSNGHSTDTKFGGNTGQILCVGYSEIDKYAIKVYERHFGGHKNYGDATKINPKELPDFDLLVGGFPCQAFSIAGKRKGFDDTRGTLFFDIARILAEKKPQHLVLENVKGLLSHDQGRTFQTILGVLADLGYAVEWQVLNSKDFGVPQNRERIIIIGHLRTECGRKILPITRENKKVSGNVFIDESQWRREGKLREYKGISPTLNTNGGGGHLPLVANTLDANYHKGNSVSSNRHTPRTQIQEGARIRRLTPKECERLQGFPDDWTKNGINDEPISDTQRYKMCGNAVTTNVITAVMERLL